MTIGTGFFGRSSVAENLHPSHLVQWTRLAYNSDRAEPFGDFTGLTPWQAQATGAGAAVPAGVQPAGRRAGHCTHRAASCHPGPFGRKWFQAGGRRVRCAKKYGG